MNTTPTKEQPDTKPKSTIYRIHKDASGNWPIAEIGIKPCWIWNTLARAWLRYIPGDCLFKEDTHFSQDEERPTIDPGFCDQDKTTSAAPAHSEVSPPAMATGAAPKGNLGGAGAADHPASHLTKEGDT